MRTKLLTLLLTVLIFQNSKAQNPQLTFTLFSNGTLDYITDIVNAGDKRLFVVQQGGIISVLDSAGNVNPTPFLDLSNEVFFDGGEEGLLGLAFSPDYKTSGYFFVHYTDANQAVHIARFKVSTADSNVADKSSEVTVLQIYHPFANHNGGNIAFGPDGYLYDGIGDGGNGGDPGNRSQNLDTLLGKILRLDVSSLPYKIPPSNPFAGSSSARPEIWAYGLRNPWCWSFDKLKGDLWIGDAGQDLWEEVDFQPANDTGGENYGWRCYEGDAAYDMSLCGGITNFTFPVDTYGHSNVNGCVIIGGYVYRGAQYKSLFGKYLYTDNCSGLFRMINDSNGIFKRTVLNVLTTNECTKFGEDIYNNLYVSEREPGQVYKIGDTSCTPVAFISLKDTIFAGGDTTISALYGQGLTYQWKYNNKTLGGNNNTVVADSGGTYTVIVSNGTCSSTASVVVEVSTGINKIQVFKNLQIAPNPNKGVFDLNVSLYKAATSAITICDVLGRTLFAEDLQLNSGKNILHIDKEDLSEGFYFLKLKSADGESEIKFIVTE